MLSVELTTDLHHSYNLPLEHGIGIRFSPSEGWQETDLSPNECNSQTKESEKFDAAKAFLPLGSSRS